jgi:hypothetical protein
VILRTNIIKYNKGDLFKDSHSTVARWSQFGSQLLNVLGASNVRQSDIQRSHWCLNLMPIFTEEKLLGRVTVTRRRSRRHK